MKTTRNRRVLVFAFLLAATLLASIAYAGLIVVYPIQATVTEYQPPVVFDYGSNANKTGLRGNPLTVTLGPQKTSATLQLQATYQTTYIHDILQIKNTDTHTYYVAVKVDTPITTCAFSQASIILRIGTDKVTLDVTKNTISTPEITLPASGTISVDFMFVIDETASLDSTPCNLNLKLVYSPESGNSQHAP